MHDRQGIFMLEDARLEGVNILKRLGMLYRGYAGIPLLISARKQIWVRTAQLSAYVPSCGILVVGMCML